MKKFLDFIKYNNAFTLIIGFIFLGTTATFAASPDVRNAVSRAVVSETTTVLSLDNTYLLAQDFDNFDSKLQITAVTEDESTYYITYTYTTIVIVDSVWREVAQEGTLTLTKKEVTGRDLGLYVAEELGEMIDNNLVYLREVQEAEKEIGETQKMVAIAYSGLVGKFLSSEEKTFDGYEPVVEEEEKTNDSSSGGANTDTQNDDGNTTIVVMQNTEPNEGRIREIVAETVRELLAEGQKNKTSSTVASQETQAESSGKSGTSTSNENTDSEAPVITINGNNPAQLDVGASYGDLGAQVRDNVNDNLGIYASVNGKDIGDISKIKIDTSKDGTHTIEYRATDQAGNTGTATRTVIVGSGESGVVDDAEDLDTETATTTPETEQEQIIEPEPEPDTTAPVVILVGGDATSLTVGDIYTDKGATATDNKDGDITDKIVKTGSVDISKTGTYVIKYNVADTAGNKAVEKKRTVTVVEAPASVEGSQSSGSETDGSLTSDEASEDTTTEEVI